MAPKKKRRGTGGAEPTVRLQIVCRRPLAAEQFGAEFGLQDNSTSKEWIIHPGRAQANGDLFFECACRVRPDPKTGFPRFLGPFIHGNASERFLYLSWRPKGWKPGAPEPVSCWVRRMKVHLKSIGWAQIEQVLRTGGWLETIVEGTGRDGGPSCASVELLGGWRAGG